MGFSFTGIISNKNSPEIIAAAKAKWPFCRTKSLSQHNGLVITTGLEESYADYDDYDNDRQRFVYEIADFSALFPEVSFAYLYADCHGGTCYYTGESWKNAQLIIDLRQQNNQSFSMDHQREKLINLMGSIQIELSGDAYFEPLTREFLAVEKPAVTPAIQSQQPMHKPWWKFWG